MFGQIFDAEKTHHDAPPAAAPVVSVPAADSDEFDPTAFPFEARAYRIHFRNGNSGEYNGAVLAHTFPFDPREIEHIEPVEEVGKAR